MDDDIATRITSLVDEEHHLRERGGSIVNLGSNTAINGVPLFGAYAIAKEGIRALSRVAANECRRLRARQAIRSAYEESAALSRPSSTEPAADALLSAAICLLRPMT